MPIIVRSCCLQGVSASLPEVEYIQGDVEDAPLEEESVDRESAESWHLQLPYTVQWKSGSTWTACELCAACWSILNAIEARGLIFTSTSEVSMM